MRFTPRGWAAAGVSSGLLALWVLFGEIELATVGIVTAGAIIWAAIVTMPGRGEITVNRRIEPDRVHEGEEARVELRIAARRLRRMARLTLVDPVEKLGEATFEVGRSVDSGSARYQIRCRPRGVYQVGPTILSISDPLELANRRSELGPIDRLVVFPAVEELSGFPMARGRDPSMQASRPEFAQRGGEDFFTLREYLIGDDLRHVHWPSSAKQDELMIKQLETPWKARALIIFDTRKSAYENGQCFEQAVKGTASIVRHLAKSGFDAHLWTGGSSVLDVTDYMRVMETLALIEPESRRDIRSAASQLRQSGRGGALVLITGVADNQILEVHRALSREYRTTIVATATETSSTSEIAFQRAGALTMTISPEGSWSSAWRGMTERAWRSTSVS